MLIVSIQLLGFAVSPVYSPSATAPDHGDMMSVGPPGANGTISRIGFVGYSCALTTQDVMDRINPRSEPFVLRFMLKANSNGQD